MWNQISKRTSAAPKIWVHKPGIGSGTILSQFNIEIPLKMLSMFFLYIHSPLTLSEIRVFVWVSINQTQIQQCCCAYSNIWWNEGWWLAFLFHHLALLSFDAFFKLSQSDFSQRISIITFAERIHLGEVIGSHYFCWCSFLDLRHNFPVC